MKLLSHLALLMLIIGGLNAGFIGALDFNLVEAAFGSWPLLVAFIYDIIGLAACFMLYQMAMCAAGRGGCCKK